MSNTRHGCVQIQICFYGSQTATGMDGYKPLQVWLDINCLWGRCWCGRPRESFERGRRVYCSKLHADLWQTQICRSWSAVRYDILERDSYVCWICGIKDDVRDIDHILPKSLGWDEWNPDNLQVLCRDCHELKTLQDNKLFLADRRSEGMRYITD